MDVEESMQFGQDRPPRNHIPRWLLLGIGAGAVIAAGLWSDRNEVSAHHEQIVNQAPTPAVTSIDSREGKLTFTGLGSFLTSKGDGRLVGTEFSNLSCRHHSVHAEMFVSVGPREMLHFSDVKLPQNSLTVACLMNSGTDMATQPWITIGGYSYRYQITDARPPAATAQPSD